MTSLHSRIYGKYGLSFLQRFVDRVESWTERKEHLVDQPPLYGRWCCLSADVISSFVRLLSVYRCNVVCIQPVTQVAGYQLPSFILLGWNDPCFPMLVSVYSLCYDKCRLNLSTSTCMFSQGNFSEVFFTPLYCVHLQLPWHLCSVSTFVFLLNTAHLEIECFRSKAFER